MAELNLSADRTVAHRCAWQDVVYASDGSDAPILHLTSQEHKAPQPTKA